MSKSIEACVREHGFCVIHPKGTSMFPMIRGCSEAYIVRAELPLNIHDVPVYKRADGSYVMHRVLGIDSDGYICCGDNQWVVEHGVTDSRIVGVLDSWYKGKKKHTVKDRGYLRYVRFWCKSLRFRHFILYFCHKYMWIKAYAKEIAAKLKKSRRKN